MKKIKKNLADIGLEAFENNQNNFYKRFRQIIIDDESFYDETTEIKVFSNSNSEDILYFRFEISTCRTHLSTDYYRFDYNFNEGQENNVDEIISNQEDFEIRVYIGTDIIANCNEY